MQHNATQLRKNSILFVAAKMPEADRQLFAAAMVLAEQHEWQAAAPKFLEVATMLGARRDRAIMARYNHGCCVARMGDVHRAAAVFAEAVAEGFLNLALAESDPDMDACRDLPVFQAALAVVRMGVAAA